MLRDALDAFKCGPILHDHPRFLETERFDEVCEPWAKRGKFIDITLQLEAILKIEKREHLLKNFLNEGVDDAVLGYLTDADLKDLGVAKIGDRRRLLAAFAKLNHEGTLTFLGRFKSEEEAAEAYDKEAAKYGKLLNFPTALEHTQATKQPLKKKAPLMKPAFIGVRDVKRCGTSSYSPRPTRLRPRGAS